MHVQLLYVLHVPACERERIRCGWRGLVGSRAPTVVKSQLTDALKLIVRTDYPEHWPGLLILLVDKLKLQVRNLRYVWLEFPVPSPFPLSWKFHRAGFDPQCCWSWF